MAKAVAGITTISIAIDSKIGLKYFGMATYNGIIKAPWIIKPRKTR